MKYKFRKPVCGDADNANKHPGLRPGLSPEPGEAPLPPPSPSAEEKKDEQNQKAAELRVAAKHRQWAQAGVAAIEDSLRREDVDRELLANHPPPVQHAPVLAFSKTPVKTTIPIADEDIPEDIAAEGLDESKADGYEEGLGLKGNPDDSGEDSNGYIPNDDELEELDNETAMMDVDQDEDDLELVPATAVRGRGKGRGGSRGARSAPRGRGARGRGARGGRGGGKVSARDAITAQRSTSSASGTPNVTKATSRKQALTASAEDSNVGKKTKPAAKSGISIAFKPLQQQRQRGNDVHRIQDSQPEDDSAFQFGGYAADKEDDSAEHNAASNEDIAAKGKDGQVDLSKFTVRYYIFNDPNSHFPSPYAVPII
ncbi:hypothetical protein CPB85DRAFT_1438345 [Mucidula mucida]|nr:hypothetical protein CPB85DRAFT_1438345 [Mucidula mucida]